MTALINQFLSAKQVAERTSMSVSSIRRLAGEKRFPQPVKITENRIAWLSTDVDRWITQTYTEGKAANDNDN